MSYRDGFDGNGHGGPVLPVQSGNGSHTPQAVAMRYHLHVLRRRWWLVALVTLTVVAGAWWRARTQIPQYTSEMQLRKMPDRTLEAGWAGFYDLTPEAISAEIQIVQSQGVLEQVVDSVGARLVLDQPHAVRSQVLTFVSVNPSAPNAAYALRSTGGRIVLYDLRNNQQRSSAAPGELLLGPGFLLRTSSLAKFDEPVTFRIIPREEAVGSVRGGLNVTQVRTTNILAIRHTSSDPVYSADVANAVGESYAWYSGRMARREASERKEALQSRLEALEDSLRLAQQVLRGADQVPGSVGAVTNSGAVMAEVLRARGELRQIEFKRTRLEEIRTAMQRDAESSLQRAIALGDDLPGARQLYDQYLLLEKEKLNTKQVQAVTDDAPEIKRINAAMRKVLEDLKGLVVATIEQNDRLALSHQTRIRELEAELGVASGRMADTDALRQEAEALQRVYLSLNEKYYEAQINERLESGAVEIISDAVPPRTPDNTRTTRSFFFAMLVGLILGVLAAFVLEQMDTRVRDAEDAQRAAAVGVIGMIPELRGDASRPLAIRSDDHTLGAEAYRKLRTNLRFLRADRPRVIAVTSPSPDEGKSVTAANLALAIAQQGQDVLIIDADLRRPVQHEIFGIERGAGLSDALVGLVDPFDAILPYEDLPNLGVLNCGTEAPNPAELLGSEAFSRLLSTLLERYDTIIVDTPPVNLVTDAAVISSVTDGVILVAEAGRTDRSILASAVNELRQARGSVLGIVLNRVTPGGRYGRYGGYYSGRMYYKREAGANSNGDRLTTIKDWVSALI